MSGALPKPSAGGPRPAEAVDKRALQPYLRVQHATDREIITILQNALDNVESTMKQLEGRVGIGARVRYDQLAQSRLEILQTLRDVWTAVGNTMTAARYDAAAAGVESIGIYDKMLFRAVGRGRTYDELTAVFTQWAKNSIDLGITRQVASKIQLSANVYRAQALSSGQIDETLTSMLTRGTSAKEIADAVIDFIDPEVSGGVSYSALRLGRTELNNAFHATQNAVMGLEPWVIATQWNLSGSHPRPDTCDDYADDAGYNGNPGQYESGSAPASPHPMCLCFLTPVLMNESNFMNALNSGAFDGVFDSYAA